jgi:ParB-like chromosome segregation protein Spo0J
MTLKKRLEKLEAKAPPKTVWPADNIERRKVSALIPYARNARTHSDAQVAQIAASIREWGWTNPVLIDAEGGLIAGHGRVLAARKLGIEDVPCMIATGWSDAQKKAYILADNQLALNAGWDKTLLGGELQDLNAIKFDIGLVGFDPQMLEDLMYGADFAPGSLDEQGKLDELAPKIVICPHCGEDFDVRLQEA